MMKSIKFAALALAVMALTVACKNKPAEVEDTCPVEETCIEAVVDSVVDTTVAEVAEEVATQATTVKKAATKKVENKSGMKAAKEDVTPSGKSSQEQAESRLSRGMAQNSEMKGSDDNTLKKNTSEQNAVGRLNSRK